MDNDLSQYGESMECPITGLKIPKTMAGNLAWRKRLLEEARRSPIRKQQILQACASSPYFWINFAGWTYLQRKVIQDGTVESVQGEGTHIPFITWKVQDEAIAELMDAIDKGKDALISKSRDMGATWLVLALFMWYWQFRPGTTFLVMSRKAQLVDRRGDMDALFDKLRYLLNWQPEWMRPRRIRDHKMHLENQDIGTAIEGESTNEHAGQGSRKTAILLDEFARVKEGADIDLATADSSACRIFNSTPGGPNTHFSQVYTQIKAGARKGKLIILPWWRHPDKGRDAFSTVENNKTVLTSPWRELEKTRRTARNLAQNIDMEHGRAGDMFFDPETVEGHRTRWQAEPTSIGMIRFNSDLSPSQQKAIILGKSKEKLVWLDGGPVKPWRLWLKLVPDPKTETLRPPQNTRYVIAVDISIGSGASNSVISVMDVGTSKIVAKFWDSSTGPEDLAMVAAVAGTWFGGQDKPLIIFEKNGPGIRFGKKLVELEYPNIYYQRNTESRHEDKSPRWGWHSSNSRKEMVLGQYAEALKLDQVKNPCSEALTECLLYSYDEHGRIEPGFQQSDDGFSRALHGDHVIADALLLVAKAENPNVRPIPSARPQYGSYEWLRKRDQRSRKELEEGVWTG